MVVFAAPAAAAITLSSAVADVDVDADELLSLLIESLSMTSRTAPLLSMTPELVL